MLEYVQTDVYVRARRLAGEEVLFSWADDTHGTPIQIRARKEGISPEALIAKAYEEHLRDFKDFGLSFDVFHSTHSPESQAHCETIFKRLEAAGHIESRSIDQLYCEHDRMFLPDRFVRGTCPKCGAEDQYGDVCEKCSSTYAPTELVDARCSICGNTPELRASEHLFVPLARHEAFISKWSQEQATLQSSVRNFIRSWIDGGLRDWDISRDEPYFGFEIPGHPGKYFYVWFDAPIGYVGATQKWCDDNGQDIESYWQTSPDDCEIIHVIGKDIVYFHCLFWPAMLNAAGYTVPSRVQVHGYLTVDGEKMSKSRGTFVMARTYLDHLDPSYLRYYFAAKLGSGQDDFDLHLEDFTNRVNADLVNKMANLASRCSKFLSAKLGGTLGELEARGLEIVQAAQKQFLEVAPLYREFESAKAIRVALEMAEQCNGYLTEAEPWKLAKSDPERARSICSAGIQISLLIAAILKPVLPQWAERCERMFALSKPLNLAELPPLLPAGHAILPYETLADRIDPKKLKAMIEASKETVPPAAVTDAPPPKDGAKEAEPAEIPVDMEPLAEICEFDDFMRADLRVGEVRSCEAVEGSKKLLRLSISLGPLGERNILSGIAQSYAPEQLVGQKVAVVANLKPRKMRFGISEGMVLASGSDPNKLSAAILPATARPGDRIS